MRSMTARPASASVQNFRQLSASPARTSCDRELSETELAQSRAELAKLLPLWPSELADMSPSGRERLIATLARALRAERRRGLGGHWTYNLARHMQLLRAYRLETAAARDERRERTAKPAPASIKDHGN